MSLIYSYWWHQSAIPCCWCNDVLADYFFQRTIQVIIWWYEVNTTGLMQRQHCPSKICDSLCGVHTCIQPSIILEEQQIRCFSCGTNLTNVSIQTSYCCNIASGVHCCPPRWKFLWMAAFSSQKPVTMIFPAGNAVLNCFFLGNVGLDRSIGHHLDSGSKCWPQGPRFYPLWEAVTGSRHLQCQISAKYQWPLLSSSLCVQLAPFVAPIKNKPWNSQAL